MNSNRTPQWCPDCVRQARGFSAAPCPKCGRARRVLGYARRTDKPMTQPAHAWMLQYATTSVA